jgi:hypothetical protein
MAFCLLEKAIPKDINISKLKIDPDLESLDRSPNCKPRKENVRNITSQNL